MKKIDIMSKRDVRGVERMMTDQWGSAIPEGRIFLRSRDGSLHVTTEDAVHVNDTLLRIDSIGLYIGAIESGELRLSIEGSQLIGPMATKGIIDLDESGMRAWIRGDDVATDDGQTGFLLVRFRNDFLGTGKIKNGMLLNFFPKSRRITTSPGSNI
jgi:NOL1/NOP2/fmu family ribosome biogenesis protein